VQQCNECRTARELGKTKSSRDQRHVIIPLSARRFFEPNDHAALTNANA
jgi:hypothetical protein